MRREADDIVKHLMRLKKIELELEKGLGQRVVCLSENETREQALSRLGVAESAAKRIVFLLSSDADL